LKAQPRSDGFLARKLEQTLDKRVHAFAVAVYHLQEAVVFLNRLFVMAVDEGFVVVIYGGSNVRQNGRHGAKNRLNRNS